MGNSRSKPRGKQTRTKTDQDSPQTGNENLQTNVDTDFNAQWILRVKKVEYSPVPKRQHVSEDEQTERECTSTPDDDINYYSSDSSACSDKQAGTEQAGCSNDTARTEPLATVAIDFGTTYTGYAFSLSGRKDSIMTARHGGMLQDDKVPTSVLLNPDKTFDSFGYVAQSRYGSLSAEERKNYYYLEHFKMALYHTEKLTRGTNIKDKLNKEVNALHVFSVSIRYFYDLAFRIAKDKWVHVKEHHIGWILTIPAIWTDSARQFMREAAIAAGISENRLRLVLEPEAASLFCQEAKVLVIARKIEQLPIGHKYILADLGGGTVDICIHEIIQERNLREIYRTTGGDHGGNKVNKAYFQFLENVFGTEVWRKFIERSPNPSADMMKDFERKKKSFSLTSTPFISVDIEDALLDILESDTDESLESRIAQSMYRNDISFKEETGHLRISSQVMETFFLPTVNDILDKLQEILNDCNDPDLQTLMLVGGFADSPYLRDRIVDRFPSLKLVLHSDTRLAVLKGAVMMGYMPRNIVQRRARFTYGFSYRVPFIPGEHPESLKFTRDGEDWCTGVFRKMIEKDQLLQYGDTFTREAYNTARDMELKHKEWHIALWRSNRRNPVYCEYEPGEEDCEMVAVIVERPPPGGWPDYMKSKQQLIVGETEFIMKYINKNTGEEYEAQVDFL